MRKYCGCLKNEISSNCVFCREMVRNNRKNGFWADVSPFVRSSVRALLFFACFLETERASARKISNRLPRARGKQLFQRQDHPAKFAALAGPNKAKFRHFENFFENGFNDFLHFLYRDTRPYKEQLFPLKFFRKKSPSPENPKILKFYRQPRLEARFRLKKLDFKFSVHFVIWRPAC